MFRINIYLDIYTFFLGLFSNKDKKQISKFIAKELTFQSQKKYLVFASQCRVGFLFILKYLKLRSKKKEIIFSSYNLPEMVNVAVKLNFKIIFCDIDYNTGTINKKELNKKITKNTSAIVLTNMFNNYHIGQEIKKLASNKKITLIEDNAIYFDNFTKKKNKKIYAGFLGDYSIYSFNIMKNISSFYGGAITTNNKDFVEFYRKEYEKLKKFSVAAALKQIFIYFILKVMSLKFLYKILFIHIIRYAHLNNIKRILKIFYPSLTSIKVNLPKYYFTRMSELSKTLTYLQLKDIKRRKKLFNLRKIKHNYYVKKLSKIRSNNISFIRQDDKNYQNFLDLPLLVKNKDSFNKYLLKNGIETRYKHYYNCERLFKKSSRSINAKKYENELICLPLHERVTFSYIDYVVKNIERYIKAN